MEKLEASGEAETLYRRHSSYYLALAEEAEPHLTGAEQALWLERLEREHGNLRAALSWVERSSEGAEINLCLAGSLWRFWYARGHLSEARSWLTRALARGETASSGTYAKALQGAGVLADAQGDYALARGFLEKALTIRRELGDQEGIAASLNSLGLVLEEQGDAVSALRFLTESLTLRRELGDTWGVAASLTNLGKVAYDQGDYAAARPLFEEGLALFRSLRDNARIAALLTNMGSVSYAQGDYEGARLRHEESLAIWRELADEWGIAISLYNLAEAAHGLGDDAAACSLFGESLAMFWRMGDKKSTAGCFENPADLAARKEPERAARLWGAAEGLRDALGSPLAPHERPAHEGQVEKTARARLGEVRFAAAWAEGRNSGLEGTIALALQKT